jgi:hypothetical protein
MLHVAVIALRQSVTLSLNFEGDSMFSGSSPFKGSLALGCSAVECLSSDY